MTINVRPQWQDRMNRYCDLSGLTREAAIDNMFALWERLIFIPETSYLEKSERRRKAINAIERQRAKAERGEAPDLTIDEIDAEIALVRAERLTKKAAQ